LVLTPEQLMVDAKPVPGPRVLVVDYEGYFTSSALAELLAAAGHAVTIMTCFDVVAPHCDQTLEGYRVRERLHSLGVKALCGLTVAEITAAGAVADGAFGRRVEVE